MSAGNGDAVFHPHQFGQHLGARNDRHMQLLGLDHLRVVIMNCGRDHHNIDVFQIVGGVADADFRTQSGQTFGDVRLSQIGAGNFVPQIEQNFCNAAHADAADTDEVYFIDFSVHGLPSS